MDKLISYCLDKEDLALIYAFPKELMDETDRQIVDFIREEHRRYGSVPGKNHVARYVEEFVPYKNTKKLTNDILSETIRKKKDIAWRAFIAEADEIDTYQYEEAARELLRVVSANPVSVHEFSTYDRNYYFATAKGTLPVFTPYMTQVTGGIGRGELAYVIGRYGVGKTLLVQHNIISWYLQGKRTLVVSNDMPSQLMMGRFDALVTGIDSKRFKMNKVGKDDVRLKVLRHIASTLDGEIIIPKGQVLDVNTLYHIHNLYECDAIVVDGVYFMGMPGRGKVTRSWEVMSEVSKDLKALSKELKVPIVGVHQANRQGEVAYSDSLGQDADLIVQLTKGKREDEEEEDKEKVNKHMDVTIELMKNRTGPSFASRCTFDFERYVLYEKRIMEII